MLTLKALSLFDVLLVYRSKCLRALPAELPILSYHRYHHLLPPVTMSSISIDGLRAVMGVFTALGVGLTIGRFYLHWHKRESARPASLWADYLNGAACVFLLGYIGTQASYLPLFYQLQLFARRQGPPPTYDMMVTYFRVEFAQFLLFWMVIYLVKFSFLALYYALFAISKPFRAAWWGVTAFTVLAFLVDFLASLWDCGSPSGLFDPRACTTKANGLIGQNVIILGAVVNIVSDITIMVLPLCMLATLKVNRAQKIGLAAVFAIGIFDVACDLLRTVATFKATVTTVFNVLEPMVAVIVCALPCYRSLIGGAFGGKATEWFRSWFSSVRSGRSGASSGLGAGRALIPEKRLGSAGSGSTATSASSHAPMRVADLESGRMLAPTAAPAPRPMPPPASSGKGPKSKPLRVLDSAIDALESPLNYGLRHEKMEGSRFDV